LVASRACALNMGAAIAMLAATLAIELPIALFLLRRLPAPQPWPKPCRPAHKVRAEGSR